MTDENVTPNEIYDFDFSHEDAIIALRRVRKPHCRALLAVVLAAALIFFMYLSEKWAIPCALLVLLFGALPQIIVLLNLKKSWEKTYNKLREIHYHFEVFDAYINFTGTKHGEVVNRAKIYLCDIDRVKTDGAYFLFTAGGIVYTIRRSEIPDTSVLLNPKAAPVPTFAPAPAPVIEETPASAPVIKEAAPAFEVQPDLAEASAPVSEPSLTPEPVVLYAPAPVVPQKKSKLPTFSWILFVGCLLMIQVGFLALTALIVPYPFLALLMSVFLILISVGSIVFGAVMKKKGLRGTKNIVVGIITTAIFSLFLLASLVAVYESVSYMPYENEEYEEYEEREEHLEYYEDIENFETFEDLFDSTQIYEAEQLFNIDISEYVYSSQTTDIYVDYTYIHHSTHLHFSEYDTDMLMHKIPNDGRWRREVPDSLMAVFAPNISYTSNEDYILIYNKDTDEYNKLPSEDGTYRFISLIFNPIENSLTIVEYDVNYTK